MATYKEEDCQFVYRIEAVTKIVDGDTVDCVFDLGFDVMFLSRVRLLGIDTPESRTRHKNEKVYGLISKKKLKNWKTRFGPERKLKNIKTTIGRN